MTIPGGSLIPVVVSGVTSYIDIAGLMERAAAEGAVGEANTASNEGTGEGLVKTKVGVNLPFKTLVAGANVSLTSAADTITIASTGGGSGEANTSSSVGAGVSIVKPKVGVDLPFKSVIAGSNVTITEQTNTITIAAAAGGGSFTGGDVANPIKVWRSAGSSTRGLDSPALRVVDTTGVAFRALTVFADESITQIGPTPLPAQWPEYGVTTVAPAATGGPTKGVSASAGLHLFNGPLSGDSNILLIANAATPSSNTTYSARSAWLRGPNQQTDIGIDGGPLSQGMIRGAFVSAGGDGGVRITSNALPLSPYAGVGTVSRTGTTLTFSTGQDGALFLDAAIYFTISGTEYGTSILSRASTTSWGCNSTTGGDFAGLTFRIEGQPSLDPNRGMIKYGTDSLNNSFGIKYRQPANSPYAAVNFGGDFDFRVWPGGYATADAGYASNTDIGVTGAGRYIRIVTPEASTGWNGAPLKVAMEFGAYYSAFPNTSGTITVRGKMKLQGGFSGERAALRIADNTGAPDAGNLEDGDIWRIGDVLYCRVAGVTKSLTFV